MRPYRKIWKEKNGPIPVDENGQSYEIHHINGDAQDNDLTNLRCVSIREHFDIHLAQGDNAACAKILLRMATTPEEYEEKVQMFTLKGENHPMWGKTHTEEAKKKIGKSSSERNSGENNPLYGKKHSDESLQKMRNNRKGKGTGPRSKETRKRMSEGVPEHTCPHCGKTARGSSMFRWHFDNCKHKK